METTATKLRKLTAFWARWPVKPLHTYGVVTLNSSSFSLIMSSTALLVKIPVSTAVQAIAVAGGDERFVDFGAGDSESIRKRKQKIVISL